MGKVLYLFQYYGGNKMETIYLIADAFLSFESMTPKKLQKLCYYAQAWSLVLRNEPLFNNEFQAWVHGPVCPELYQKYKDFRWNDIPKVDLPLQIDEEVAELISEVYETYGDLDGDQLEALTHSETPWREQRKGLEEWEPSNNIITKESMVVFYGKMYESNQGE
ncbi:Panacea domain-containing protein [Clostridium culturomicium]|uniref:Panacea domain-containing protein n=1 Tax=Clostridium culturomicium TaxID=1499683 RepID=UPI00385772D2